MGFSHMGLRGFQTCPNMQVLRDLSILKQNIMLQIQVISVGKLPDDGPRVHAASVAAPAAWSASSAIGHIAAQDLEVITEELLGAGVSKVR